MRKLTKNWYFISILLLIILCSVFFLYMLADVSSQPSKRWSKGLLLAEVDNSKVSESSRIRIVTIPKEATDEMIVLWNEKDVLSLMTIDQHGTIENQRRINAKLGEPTKMSGNLSNGSIELYLLESGELRKYKYDLATQKLSNPTVIKKLVNDFLLENGVLLIASDNGITAIYNNGKRKEISKKGAQLLSAYQESGEVSTRSLHIASTRSDGKGLLFIDYTVYNPSTNKSETYAIGKQFMGNNEMGDFDNLLICSTNQTMNIMASRKFQIPSDTCRRLPRSTNNRILLYSFDKENVNPAKVKTSLINEITSVEPNPIRNIANGKEFGFICSTTVSKGRKSYSINLMQYQFKNGVAKEKELLTNTAEISREPHWYKLDKNEYVQWEDRTGTSTRIMVASTDQDMITKAGRLSGEMIWSTLLDSIMPLGFSLSYLFLIFSCIMLPTLIFVAISAVFFINWTERNNKLATMLACGIHVFAGVGMILLYDLKNLDVSSIEPAILQNPACKVILVVALATLSYRCMQLRFGDDRHDKSFINQYLFFSVHNMLLFALLIFPYYYI